MMYASTSCDGTGTTTSEFDLRWERTVAAGDRHLGLAERKAWIYENWMRFMGRLGAVVGHGVKYWPATAIGPAGPQVLLRRPVVILAGYMSQSRGLAWDRRSRRGRK